MDNYSIVDVSAGGLFLFFTGVETFGTLEGTVIEIISKFGVVAVLWFWLREMKQQMKDMMSAFDKETSELRNEHKAQMDRMDVMYKDYKDRMDNQVKLLQDQLNHKS